VRKHDLLRLRPSHLLGLFFALMILVLMAFIAWENKLFGPKWFGVGAPRMIANNWLVLFGVVSGITGWVVSAYITLRNSIKQHTINTMLQSRLSATYMEHAKVINKNFFAPSMINDPPTSLDYMLSDEHSDQRAAVDYVLNYFEFLAVGIRHGDLDRSVLSHTLRGIVVRLYEKKINYLRYMRKDDGITIGNPTQLEHLTWLYECWTDEIKNEKKKEKCTAEKILKKSVQDARQKKFYADMIDS